MQEGDHPMKRLFWGLVAPTMILLSGLSAFSVTIYPHYFWSVKSKTVQVSDSGVSGASVFFGESSICDLTVIPDKTGTGYAVYTVDTEVGSAGRLDNREIIVGTPWFLLVKDADRYSKLVEANIYDLPVDPLRYHFTTEDGRRIDVSYIQDKHGSGWQWPRLLSNAFRVSMAIGMLLSPPLFLVTGWLGPGRRHAKRADWRERLSLWVMIVATLTWLTLLALVFVPDGQYLSHGFTGRIPLIGDWTPTVWVGFTISLACVFAGLAGSKAARRSIIYLSMALVFTWIFVGSF
jgi:hypothetical protein